MYTHVCSLDLLLPCVQFNRPCFAVLHSFATCSPDSQSDGGDSHATKFHMDLEHWVTEVSEVFHYRIFFIDSWQLLVAAWGESCKSAE